MLPTLGVQYNFPPTGNNVVIAVCIARFTRGVFDDDGGKTHQGGKKQHGQHKTGGAAARKCASNHQMK